MGKVQLQLQAGFIDRLADDEVVTQRISDGYFNATAMCKASGKRLTIIAVYPLQPHLFKNFLPKREFPLRDWYSQSKVGSLIYIRPVRKPLLRGIYHRKK